jgi:type VI secretion system protein ImpB
MEPHDAHDDFEDPLLFLSLNSASLHNAKVSSTTKHTKGSAVMASTSSQKFIGRNRPPRVQIEYDVEVYGSEKKIQLPFITGVMADLSGKPLEELPSIAERKFLEIDIDNFDERMKAIKPHVAFHVPNTLTGEKNLAVDLTFEKMDDFSPGEVAKNVEPLNKLLTARQQLANLIAYMDGKSGAEDALHALLDDPALLEAVANTPKPASSGEPTSGSTASP